MINSLNIDTENAIKAQWSECMQNIGSLDKKLSDIENHKALLQQIEKICQNIIDKIIELTNKDQKLGEPESAIANEIKTLIKYNTPWIQNQLYWTWIADYDDLWGRFLTNKMIDQSSFAAVIKNYHTKAPTDKDFTANLWSYKYGFSVISNPLKNQQNSEKEKHALAVGYRSPKKSTDELGFGMCLHSSLNGTHKSAIIAGSNPGYLHGLLACPIPRTLINYDEEVFVQESFSKQDIDNAFSELVKLDELLRNNIKPDAKLDEFRQRIETKTKSNEYTKLSTEQQREFFTKEIKSQLEYLGVNTENTFDNLINNYIKNNLILALVIAESARSKTYFEEIYRELEFGEQKIELYKYLLVARSYKMYKESLASIEHEIKDIKNRILNSTIPQEQEQENLKELENQLLSARKEKCFYMIKHFIDFTLDLIIAPLKLEIRDSLQTENESIYQHFLRKISDEVKKIQKIMVDNIEQSTKSEEYKNPNLMLFNNKPSIELFIENNKQAIIDVIKNNIAYSSQKQLKDIFDNKTQVDVIDIKNTPVDPLTKSITGPNTIHQLDVIKDMANKMDLGKIPSAYECLIRQVKQYLKTNKANHKLLCNKAWEYCGYKNNDTDNAKLENFINEIHKNDDESLILWSKIPLDSFQQKQENEDTERLRRLNQNTVAWRQIKKQNQGAEMNQEIIELKNTIKKDSAQLTGKNKQVLYSTPRSVLGDWLLEESSDNNEERPISQKDADEDDTERATPESWEQQYPVMKK